MRTIWSGDTARWKRRLTAGLVTSAAAIGLVAASVTAASAAPPPPAAGVDPAVVAGSGIGVNIFYTAGNGTVWTKSPTGTATQEHFLSLRATEKPGKSFSTMKALIPFAPSSGEVFA